MALNDQRRRQLDGIVAQMGSKGAPKEAVQAVVSDFQAKYGNEPAPAAKPSSKGGASAFAEASNNAFMGGLIRNTAGLVKLATPGSVDAKIDATLKRGGFDNDANKRAAEASPAGAMAGRAQKFAAETVPSLLMGPAKTVIGRVGQNAGMNFAQTAAESSGAGKDAGSALKDALLSSVLSGGFSAGADAVGGAVSKVLSGTAKNTYNRLFKTPVADRQAGRELIGEGLMERGIAGSPEEILEALRSRLSVGADTVKDAIGSRADEVVDASPVLQRLQALRDQKLNTPGASVSGVESVLEGFRGRSPLTLDDAQTLKRNLQEDVNQNFLKDNLSGTVEAQKAAAQELRKVIEQAVPDVKGANEEQAFAIRAIQQLTRQQGHSPSQLRLFAELIGAGVGISTLNPVPLGVILAERLATNPAVATRAALVAQKLGDRNLNPAAVQLLKRMVGAGASEAISSRPR